MTWLTLGYAIPNTEPWIWSAPLIELWFFKWGVYHYNLFGMLMPEPIDFFSNWFSHPVLISLLDKAFPQGFTAFSQIWPCFPTGQMGQLIQIGMLKLALMEVSLYVLAGTLWGITRFLTMIRFVRTKPCFPQRTPHKYTLTLWHLDPFYTCQLLPIDTFKMRRVVYFMCISAVWT